MGQADSIGTHLGDDRGILVVVHPVQGVAYLRPVLVAADTPQLEMLTVQEETLVRIYVEEPQAERLLHHVRLSPVTEHGNPGPVKERVLRAVPQMRVLQTEADFVQTVFLSRDRDVLLH